MTGTVNVAMVGNPQMKTLEQLKGDFESSHPGITLNLLVLPENQVRDKVTTDISTNAAQFDLVTIGMYEVPLWAKNGWLEEVGTTLQADANYDFNDVIPSIRKGLEYNGKLYAAPFYGESSALFYRKDTLQKANAPMPEKPIEPLTDNKTVRLPGNLCLVSPDRLLHPIGCDCSPTSFSNPARC